MDELQVSGTFPTIAAADLAEFKRTASELLRLVEGEPGTLQQDWFFSEDGTECVVRERYADSAAVLTHMGNVSAVLNEAARLGGGLRAEVFGDPNIELREAIAPFGAAIYSHFRGKRTNGS